MRNMKTLFIITIAIVAIAFTGTLAAFASSSSHSVASKHSVHASHAVAHKPAHPIRHVVTRHCGAIGHVIGSTKEIGCVKSPQETPTVLVPAWQSDGQNVSPAFKPTSRWTVQYSCNTIKNMTILVTDVSRTQSTFAIIDGNTICDGQLHENTYSYLPERAITISTDRPALITVTQVR